MKKFSLILAVLMLLSVLAGPFAAIATVPETAVSVSQALLLDADTQVRVEGYYVGVSDTSDTANQEMLVKDIDSDKIISVCNIPYGTFPDYGYEKGDKLSFLATVKVSDNQYSPNKKYLEFSVENGAIETTIVSSGNRVSFDLSSATEVDTWDKMQELFTVNTLQPYSIFKFTGTTYFNYFSTGDAYRPHKNSSATRVAHIYTDSAAGGLHTLSLRNKTMTANLGDDWKSLFFDTERSGQPGTPVNKTFYAMYIAGDQYRFNFVILDETWIREREYTNADIIKEVAYAYRRQGSQIEYDQLNSRRHITPSPEDATAQHKIYLDCSSYVNVCYYEAFGATIIPESLGMSPNTANFDTYAKTYPDNADVIGYWVTEDFDTDEERQVITQWISSNLQVGDILTYRHGKSTSIKGHVYIYMGNNIFLHRAGAGSYTVVAENPALSHDNNANEANQKVAEIAFSNIFTKPEDDRYIYKTSAADTTFSFSLLRPLARNLTPTIETLGRMTIAGLAMEKRSSVYENSSVCAGDIITYTVAMKNTGSFNLKNVKITDIIPAGTVFASGSEGVSVNDRNLVWTGTVAAGASVTVSYDVQVTATVPGTQILSNDTYVSGVKLGKISHTVSGFAGATSQLITNTAADYIADEKSFDNGLAMVYALYKDSLDITLDSYDSVEAALSQIIDVENRTCYTNTELSKILVPHLYGGMDIRYGNASDNDRTRIVSEGELAIGDIILARWSGGNVVYVYTGNSKLLTLENGVCKELTIGDDIYGTDADNILISLYGYNQFAVLRPSMAYARDLLDPECYYYNGNASKVNATLASAIEYAGNGTTVYLRDNYNGAVTVKNGVILDLNGKNIAGNVNVISGQIVDSVGGGIITGSVSVPHDNPYMPLPLTDAEDAYRLFAFKPVSARAPKVDENVPGVWNFWFDLEFEDAEAYILLNGYSGLKVGATLSWTEESGVKSVEISFDRVLSDWITADHTENQGLYVRVTNIPADGVSGVTVTPYFETLDTGLKGVLNPIVRSDAKIAANAIFGAHPTDLIVG